MQRTLVLFAGISGAIAVALGALGAHYLKQKAGMNIITVDNLHAFETGVRYHIYHTLAIFGIALFSGRLSHKFLEHAANFFMVGIVLFSGSIYILSTRALFGIEGMSWLGPVTPIGGLVLMGGWIMLFIAGLRTSRKRSQEQEQE
jgi:uncharacterized membrane protein YgdD (TMEM256/DUF423 family)